MKFDSLVKIFYSNPKEHKAVYSERFSAPFAVHLPIEIQQFNHDKSYPAFYCYNQEVVLLTEQIYQLFADFLLITQNVSDVVMRQFRLSCIIAEVHSTSDIEGIHSTHRELKDILESSSSKSHFSSIIKKYDLLSSGEIPSFTTCEDVRNFYDEFVHVDAIAGNPKNLLDGKIFRKEAVDVRTPSGKIIHRGLEPEEKIIKVMSDALSYLNSSEVPALVRIAVFHYLFVYIHPFYDGNGRTARFISSCSIARHLHPLIALRLAVTIKRHKRSYYSMLKDTDAEINCGDLTPFILGFLEFIAETIEDINKILTHKVAQLERMKARLNSILLDDEARAIGWLILQASTFYGHGATMNELMECCGRSRNTVKKTLAEMPIRVSGTRTKFYKLDWERLRNSCLGG